MSFVWSDHAPHIVSLFAPWKPEDAIPAHVIHANEQRLSCRLPSLLRNFYLSWGVRPDMTQSREYLAHPNDLQIQSGALLLCCENQGVLSWSVRCRDLHLSDPPVYVAYNEEEHLDWELSHTRLSLFLDVLTYHHAFARGSLCGATSGRPHQVQIARIHSQLKEIVLEAPVWGLTRWQNEPQYVYIAPRVAVVYDSAAIYVATADTSELATVQRWLDVEWKGKWN